MPAPVVVAAAKIGGKILAKHLLRPERLKKIVGGIAVLTITALWGALVLIAAITGATAPPAAAEENCDPAGSPPSSSAPPRPTPSSSRTASPRPTGAPPSASPSKSGVAHAASPAAAAPAPDEGDPGQGGGGQFELPKPIEKDRRASKNNPPLSIPANIKTEYVKSGQKYGVPWTLLAGIGMAETGHNRLTATSSAGAQGPMMWLPQYWPAYAVDGDGDGDRDIHDVADSVATTAKRLAETGARRSPEGVKQAIYMYNHAVWYVADVLFYAHSYGGGDVEAGPGGGGSVAPCPPVTSGGMDCPVSKHPDTEKGLKPNALRILRCVAQKYPKIHRFSGVGPRPTNPTSDHPKGLAVDVWTNGPALGSDYNSAAAKAYGWAVANWLKANSAKLGVKYIIFYDKQWWANQGSDAPWKPYSHPSGATDDMSMHRDHVHVSANTGDTGAEKGDPPGVAPSGKFANPLAGKPYRVSSPFGYRIHPITGEYKLHAGVDLAIADGTPFVSGCSGRVKALKPLAGTGGNELWVDCGGGITMVYLHLSRFGTTEGATVKTGQTVGYVGNTGRSGGAHLHFEVHVNGNPTNPVPWMGKKGIEI